MARTHAWYDYPRPRRTRTAVTIAAMDEINRYRSLTEAEVTTLCRAIYQERQHKKRQFGGMA